MTAGRRAAFVSALGVETGTVLFVCLTAFGLSAVIASTKYAFAVLHYMGAAYLLFLAWRSLRSGGDARQSNAPSTRSFWNSYRQGFLVGASNPKVALFFLAFFPQFVRPDHGSTTLQILVLGSVFVSLGLAADTLNSLASAEVGRWLAWQRNTSRSTEEWKWKTQRARRRNAAVGLLPTGTTSFRRCSTTGSSRVTRCCSGVSRIRASLHRGHPSPMNRVSPTG